MPFWRLNQEVQRLAFGFGDDLPESAESLARFVDSRGQWDDSITIPDKLITEGRSLIRAFCIRAGSQDSRIPGRSSTGRSGSGSSRDFLRLRVVTVGLIRSPHEIAMSLVTRQNGLGQLLVGARRRRRASAPDQADSRSHER